VVRSKGDDLRCAFWRDLARSMLPLHRAVSGLHFHGSEKLLIATIDTLAQLGADLDVEDHAGNSVLHKAVHVCTSKSAAAVVKTLLRRGARPNAQNKEGDTPLHCECKQVRSASVEVIQALVGAGADPNCANRQRGHSHALSPLTLVLARGAACTSTGTQLVGGVGAEQFGLGAGLSPPYNGAMTADGLLAGGGDPGHTGHSPPLHSGDTGDTVQSTPSPHGIEKTRVAGRRVWIRAAEALLKSGARWDVHWRANGGSQLHLLLAAFPPPRDESSSYRRLLRGALEAGLEPGEEEERGRSALFLLCEQMAATSAEACPDASRLVHMLLTHGADKQTAQALVCAADRSGRCCLDLVDREARSCLAACRHMLRDASQGILAKTLVEGAHGLLFDRGAETGSDASLHTLHTWSKDGDVLNCDFDLERPTSSSLHSSIARVRRPVHPVVPPVPPVPPAMHMHRGRYAYNASNVSMGEGEAKLDSSPSSAMDTDVFDTEETEDKQLASLPPYAYNSSRGALSTSFFSPSVAKRRHPALDTLDTE
jgi:hypothetical protein